MSKKDEYRIKKRKGICVYCSKKSLPNILVCSEHKKSKKIWQDRWLKKNPYYMSNYGYLWRMENPDYMKKYYKRKNVKKRYII